MLRYNCLTALLPTCVPRSRQIRGEIRAKVFDDILARWTSLANSVVHPNSREILKIEDGNDYGSVKPWKCRDYRDGWRFFPSFLKRPREEGTFESRNSRREK